MKFNYEINANDLVDINQIVGLGNHLSEKEFANKPIINSAFEILEIEKELRTMISRIQSNYSYCEEYLKEINSFISNHILNLND